MPYDNNEFPSYLTLTFDGSPVGDQVVFYNTDPARATDINVRQNFWSRSVHLDGQYPALVFTHDFDVYVEKTSPRLYAAHFFNLLTYITTAAKALRMKNGNTGNDVIYFGSCYMVPPKQTKPEELMLTEAGVMRIQFKGTIVPSVTVA